MYLYLIIHIDFTLRLTDSKRKSLRSSESYRISLSLTPIKCTRRETHYSASISCSETDRGWVRQSNKNIKKNIEKNCPKKTIFFFFLSLSQIWRKTD